MKNSLLLPVKASCIVSFYFAFVGSSAFACPSQKYELNHVALNSDGLLTRTEQDVTTDRIMLGDLDEVTLNADPEMQDASVRISVKRESQKADSKGIFSTTYLIREIRTSYWGSSSMSEKDSLVTVASSYLGNGKYSARKCGTVEINEIAHSAKP